jgi:hypothetical protein
MEIKKVYATSRGFFWSEQEALKPKNRARDNAMRTGGDGYEPVREAYVLMADVEVDQGVRGIGTVTKVFKLSELVWYEIR